MFNNGGGGGQWLYIIEHKLRRDFFASAKAYQDVQYYIISTRILVTVFILKLWVNITIEQSSK